MKYAILALVATLLGLSASQVSAADWTYIGKVKGVEVYWDTEKNSAAWKSKLKMVNTNPYKVEVRFKPAFSDQDGREWVESFQTVQLLPNEAKGGDWHGMYYHPFRGKVRPDVGGVKEMSVERR